MIPFIGWGIFVLRQRYRLHQEFTLFFEAATMAGVLVFYMMEVHLLTVWAGRQPLLYFFALLGLFLAGFALYGHMAVSMASRVLVDMVFESHEGREEGPRLGPAEALERQQDYAGALQEYLVLARVYPGNATVLSRAGENLVRLNRGEEAVPLFERALKHLDSAPRALGVLTRLAGILSRDLGRPEEARNHLLDFTDRFPGTREAEEARAQLKALAERREVKISDELTALQEGGALAPEQAETEEEATPEPKQFEKERHVGAGLTALEEAPLAIEEDDEPPHAPISEAAPVERGQSALAPLDAPLTDDAEEAQWDDLQAGESGLKRLGLEAMDDAPTEEEP